jgi:flavin reductase (DIM6/NTAB) family NADH-FMN oxidoreductase RutF
VYYDPARQTSGLPHSPFSACCVPRPIGWISTVSVAGVNNLAPFSQFQNVTFDPPTVLFSACGTPAKDTLANAEATGEFVWNMATYDQRDQVARSAMPYPSEVDEFEVIGIETLPARKVRPLRVAASPVHFECVVRHVLEIPGNIPEANAKIVVGEVVGIHIRDDVINEEGRVDVERIQPLARLGYLDYTVVERKFELENPDFQVLHHNLEVDHGGEVRGSGDSRIGKSAMDTGHTDGSGATIENN